MTYRVTLRDASLASVGETQWLTLDVVARLSGVGTWTITLPTYVLPLIGDGGGVIIRRDGDVLMSGPYTEPDYNWDATSLPDGSLTLNGVSDDWVIAARRCYQVPGSVFASQTATKYTLTSVAETVIHTLVNLNAGPGAIVARRVGGLTLASDLGRGASTPISVDTGVNLLDQVKLIADANGLGVRTVQVGSGLVFQVFAPTDYSGSVRFSRALKNLTSITYKATAPVATRELVHNGGVFLEVADAGSEAAWGVRVENDVAGTATDTPTLTQDGAAQLVLDSPTTQLTVTVLDTAAAGYGRPWGLGDTVSVSADVTEIADVVREIHFHADSGGEVITPTIGTPNATAAPATSQAIRDLITHVSRLEGKV